MRKTSLSIALLLAGCQVSQTPLPPASHPSSPAPGRSAQSTTPVDRVFGPKAVGHRDFANAKKILPTIFAGMENDFYCGCRYVGHVVQLASCGYEPRRNPTRAARIEWEHVVPAWVLGHQRQCWQQGGRKHCTDTDPVFQVAEGDLNNLVPSVGELNGDRSNFAYSAWTRQPTSMYGACQTIVDFKLQRVQPREEVRGRAARITLYMHQTYGLHMSRQDRQLMCAWSRTHLVDAWERQRDERIVRWQGSGNPLVSDPARLKATCG
ncbi:endonuclease [Accumulibacter sp.]|uniref:endonuclease n=1 Tax=Accumulibacter sp. TaxID=2053492 RepID=UPI002BFC1E30|nr:endonuclease [Accumulibacter sp.]HPU80209.1 endonuclease [Accumulibacter sp.]